MERKILRRVHGKLFNWVNASMIDLIEISKLKNARENAEHAP